MYRTKVIKYIQEEKRQKVSRKEIKNENHFKSGSKSKLDFKYQSFYDWFSTSSKGSYEPLLEITE